jgi:hypothetical protein
MCVATLNRNRTTVPAVRLGTLAVWAAGAQCRVRRDRRTAHTGGNGDVAVQPQRRDVPCLLCAGARAEPLHVLGGVPYAVRLVARCE